MNLSDLFLLQYQKKQLLDLLRNNNFPNKTWIRIEADLELLKSQKKKYEEMSESADILPAQKQKNLSQVSTLQTQIKCKKQDLHIALMKTIDKETIEHELQIISEKEEMYMEILLAKAKDAYKMELQAEIDRL